MNNSAPGKGLEDFLFRFLVSVVWQGAGNAAGIYGIFPLDPAFFRCKYPNVSAAQHLLW